ncbi:MAG: Uma2 family endonuclease [Chloroflexota bacterium]|nr:Uma2 family endonuclease [Chloroflexota bacterium]
MAEYVWQPEWELLESENEDMPTFEHGMICSRLNLYLGGYALSHKLGEVVDSSVEYRFLEGKQKRPSRYPDVSFIQQERLPKNIRSYPEIAPDLAVEVASPTDRDYDIESRVKEYQKVKVKLVWVIHPYSQTISVYRLTNGLKAQNYVGDEELEGEDVLPGFKLKVSDIFNYPYPPEEEL